MSSTANIKSTPVLHLAFISRCQRHQSVCPHEIVKSLDECLGSYQLIKREIDLRMVNNIDPWEVMDFFIDILDKYGLLYEVENDDFVNDVVLSRDIEDGFDVNGHKTSVGVGEGCLSRE